MFAESGDLTKTMICDRIFLHYEIRSEIMKKIVTYCFFAIEAVLFCTFVTMDIMNIPNSNYVKFAAIFLVGAFSLMAGKEKDNRIVTAAQVLTVVADVCLVLLGKYFWGVPVFACVQVCYAIRFSFLSGKPLVGEILKRVLPAIALGGLAAYFLGPKIGLTVFYAWCFGVNFVHGFELQILKPSKRHLIFCIGLTLFACCDCCVGITNLAPSFMTEQMIRNAAVATWIFYLPSQILILSTTNAFKLEKKEKKA